MKIAVCISGQPRAYKEGYEYLKRNLLDHYDCDIFIHTWRNRVYDTGTVLALYKPTRAKVDEKLPESVLNRKYTFTPNARNWPPFATVSSFYSLFQSLLLKVEEETFYQPYNWVVKTRFDYALNFKIDFESLDPQNLYIPNCRMVPTKDFGNDQFAFGRTNIMNDYMSTYLNLDHYYRMGTAMIGEDMMRANLRKYGLVGDRLEYVDMNNPFPPGPYNGTPHSLIRTDMDLWKKS